MLDLYEVKEVPLEGQFIAVWEYEGGYWSYVLRVNDKDCIERYCPTKDKWIRHDMQLHLMDTFYVKDRRKGERRNAD